MAWSFLRLLSEGAQDAQEGRSERSLGEGTDPAEFVVTGAPGRNPAAPFSTEGTMLVVSRNVGERIRIGDEIEIVLVRIQGKRARIGIVAPRSFPVTRVSGDTTDERTVDKQPGNQL
jgi:carbon storage regulator